MRRIAWVAVIVLLSAAVLAGCGKKDAGSVVKQLDSVMGKMESYEGAGKMTLQTGQQPQEYDVEVWYQKPSYYRISLTNEKKDVTQIVLRNDDGVFVLTPHLNKSFRFQSDWPDNQGQVYLYQSLIQSIVTDAERQFTTDGGAYVFDVQANYQNASLARQKIWLDKKTYAPQHVEVSDSNENVMVVVDFTHFEFDKKFEKDSFDMQRNMTSSSLTLPAMAGTDTKSGSNAASGAATSSSAPAAAASASPKPSDAKSGSSAASGAATSSSAPAAAASASPKPSDAKSGSTAASGAATSGTGAAKPATAQTLGTIVEPTYVPKGVKQQDMSDMKLGTNPAVMLRYSGTYNYTLVESRPDDKPVTNMFGDETVDLGYTLGSLSGEELQTLMWTYDGMEYRLASADLPLEEMIRIAQSIPVQGAIGK
ncbi:DUF4367 domain-containing protein [Paenibacillus cymbidii]|uniref:DUF4367 domain-containing protein n=1 Tax=Paenibacillus cymbidii TaxID=1639034 RepID=UPI001080C12B|nr:DUF4367 domain-containing protein [Paenibacillus cymbidii]